MFNMLTPLFEFVLESFCLEMVKDWKGIRETEESPLTF